MKKFLENLLIFLIFFILIAGAITGGVWWEITRWHTFQEVTHSHIGFWRYEIFFGGSHK